MMTNDPLAEAIAYFEDEHIVGGSTDETRMVLDAARKYHDLPVVEVEDVKKIVQKVTRGGAKDTVPMINTRRYQFGWNDSINYLRATYPNGLRWKS